MQTRITILALLNINLFTKIYNKSLLEDSSSPKINSKLLEYFRFHLKTVDEDVIEADVVEVDELDVSAGQLFLHQIEVRFQALHLQVKLLLIYVM